MTIGQLVCGGFSFLVAVGRFCAEFWSASNDMWWRREISFSVNHFFFPSSGSSIFLVGFFACWNSGFGFAFRCGASFSFQEKPFLTDVLKGI